MTKGIEDHPDSGPLDNASGFRARIAARRFPHNDQGMPYQVRRHAPRYLAVAAHFHPLLGETFPMKDKIEHAIHAHATWKFRLKQAITTGKTDTSVAVVSTDNACEFGKWLYGPTVTPEAKRSEFYLKAVKQHKDFHRAAGQVLEAAVGGRAADAEKAMGSGGAFTVASAALTNTMTDWAKVAH